MDYQNQARRSAWNDDPEVRPGDRFEIVGVRVRRVAPVVVDQPFGRPVGLQGVDLQGPAQAASGPEGWRRAFDRALAVAMNEVVEGLAICAASLHPQLFYLQSEPVDRYDPMVDFGYGERPRPLRPTLSVLREVDGAREVDGGIVPAPRAALPDARRGGFAPVPLEVAPLEVAPKASPARAGRMLSAPARLWAWLVAEYNFKRSRAVLLALSDRDLKDIGIARHDIERAVRQGRRSF